MLKKFLRFSCTSKEYNHLNLLAGSYKNYRHWRKEIMKVYRDYWDNFENGSGGGPLSLEVIELLTPAYRKRLRYLREQANLARRTLFVSITQCRQLMLPTWQIKLAVLSI